MIARRGSRRNRRGRRNAGSAKPFSGPREELEGPPSAPEPEKPPVAECRFIRIDMRLNSSASAEPETISSASSSSTRSPHTVPEPVKFEVVNNSSHTAALVDLSNGRRVLRSVRILRKGHPGAACCCKGVDRMIKPWFELCYGFSTVY